MVKVINAGLGEQLEAAIAVFGTTTRVGILRYLLKEGPAQAGTITADLKLSRNTVAAALVALEELGVILGDSPIESRHGKRVLYRANQSRIDELLGALRGALEIT